MVSIGGTVTNGIQDISALLPLLGTEQCEKHVSCALDKGFLYAAATPLSIFGSLGVVKAGIKVLLASLNFRHFRFVGAKWLEDAGFAPDGTAAEKNNVVSLIALDGSRFVAEARLDAMLQQVHIDDVDRVRLQWHCFWWNIRLASSAFVGALLALAPYIPLILSHDFHTSKLFWTGWVFPVMRAVGTSLTAVAIQIVLQFRILEITRKRLLLKRLEKNDEFMKGVLKDVKFSESADECIWSIKQQLEASGDRNRLTGLSRKRDRFSRLLPRLNCIPPQDTASAPTTPSLKPSMSSESLSTEPGQRVLKMLNDEFPIGQSFSRAWFLLLLQAGILFGLGMSVVGYIGCFSVVQTSSRNGPLIWVAVEIALSLLRIVIWASNPQGDDNTNIGFSLDLVEKPPTITCSSSKEDLAELQTLSVLRADDFLKDIAIYTGPIEPFLHDKITLYYTLTGSRTTEGKVLYVTIFDYSERATWTLLIDSWNIIEDLGDHTLSSLYGATLDVDTAQNALKVKLHNQVDATSNPITRDRTFTAKLKRHCRSIMSGIMTRGTDSNVPPIELLWSLNVNTHQTLSSGPIDAPRTSVEVAEIPSPSWPSIGEVDKLYLRIGESQKILAGYAEKRRQWIVEYVKFLRAQSATVAKERQQRIPKSPVSDIQLDIETHISTLIDLEAQEGMEILWLSEASALTEISFYYLQLVASGDESPRLRREWFQTMHARYAFEREASLARIRSHSSEVSGNVDAKVAKKKWTQAVEASCAAVEELWRDASSHNYLIRPAFRRFKPGDELLPFADFMSWLMLQWQSTVSSQFDVSKNKYTSLIEAKLDESLPTAHSGGSEMGEKPRLPDYLALKRDRMGKQWEAERVGAERRLSKLLGFTLANNINVANLTNRRVLLKNLPCYDISLSSLSYCGRSFEQLEEGQLRRSPVASMKEAENATESLPEAYNSTLLAEEGTSQIKATLEPYLQSDLPTLACVVLSNRRHADMMLLSDLPIDEFCEMVIRNPSIAVISPNGLPKEHFPKFLAALRDRRETLTSLIVESVELDSDTFTALLVAVKNNPNIVSVQLRDNHPAVNTEDLDAAILCNRQTIELAGRTGITDIIYDFDNTGFRLHGYARSYENYNKCTIYFDTPNRPETTLHIRVVIERSMLADIDDSTKDPFVLRLNGNNLTVNPPRIAQDERHYRIAIGKTLLNDQSRNQLVVAANPEYGSDAFYLSDLDILDDQGYIWEGNIAGPPELATSTAAVPTRPPSPAVELHSPVKLNNDARSADMDKPDIIEPVIPSGSSTTNDNAEREESNNTADVANTQTVERIPADENPAVEVLKRVESEGVQGEEDITYDAPKETLIQSSENVDSVHDAVDQSTVSTRHGR